MSVDSKLDIRFVINADNKKIDLLNGEFANKRAAAKRKYYHDKAKAVLTAKCHLNYLVESLPQIPIRCIKALKIPIVMVMGIDCHVFVLSLIDKNDYLLEKIHTIQYPRTYRQLCGGGIGCLDPTNIKSCDFDFAYLRTLSRRLSKWCIFKFCDYLRGMLFFCFGYLNIQIILLMPFSSFFRILWPFTTIIHVISTMLLTKSTSPKARKNKVLSVSGYHQ